MKQAEEILRMKSAWTDDLTVCNSCSKAYANEATHYGFPTLAAGGNSPDPWPLCDMHAFPMALIAGWKPVKIEDYKAEFKREQSGGAG